MDKFEFEFRRVDTKPAEQVKPTANDNKLHELVEKIGNRELASNLIESAVKVANIAFDNKVAEGTCLPDYALKAVAKLVADAELFCYSKYVSVSNILVESDRVKRQYYNELKAAEIKAKYGAEKK